MKKIILLLILFMVPVYAKNNFEKYDFYGYTENKKENTDFIKYEPIIFNKFYKNIITNKEYLPKDYYDSDRPYINFNDYKKDFFYVRDKPFYEDNHEHIISVKTKDRFKVDTINIENLDTGYDTNKIHEIEIYVKDKKIKINIPNYEYLVDDDLNNGKSFLKKSFQIKLDNKTDISDIEIKIYYDYQFGYECNFIVKFKNEQDKTLLEQKIPFNYYIEKNKKTVVNFFKYDEYDKFLTENGIFMIGDSKYMDIANYFRYFKINYLHYNIEKDYFVFCPTSYVEGYKYDETESIKLYKILKKKNDIPESEECEIDKSIIENKDNKKEGINISSTKKLINKNNIRYDNNRDTLSPSIKVHLKKESIVAKSQDNVNKKRKNKNILLQVLPLLKTFLICLFIFIIICIIRKVIKK